MRILSSSDDKIGPRRIRDYFRRHLTSFAGGVICLVLTQAFALSAPPLLRHATDGLIAGDTNIVRDAAAYLVLVAIAGALVRVLSRVLIFNSGRRVEYDLRNDCFGHLQKLSPRFFQTMPLAQVMSRLVNDLTQVRLLLGPGLLNISNTALVYLVVIPLLFIKDWELTLFALLPLPILVVLGQAFGRRLYSLSREGQDKLGDVSAKVQENLSGVMTVRAFRQEGHEKAAFTKLNEAYLVINVRLARLRGFMFPMMGLAGAIGIVVTLWLGGHRIAAGRMTVGDYVQYSAYLAALTWPTIALGWMLSLFQRGFASMARINDIFTAVPSIVDGVVEPAPLTGAISVRNLSLRYDENAKLALDAVNVEIPAGELVVIVGRTGSGKSTLLRTLARLLEIERGQVFMDGKDVVDLPLAHVRGAIGYAPQEAFLFSRSLSENVAFGVPSASADDIAKAVSIAHLTPDLTALPEGLDTIVGERGVTLSGGQRQRATLARAILTQPAILLLDDTLSAVDTETETQILRSLEALHEGKKGGTVVIATHRLACAANADRVIVLDAGKVVEQGSEADLLALDGIYADMHRRQRLERALEGAGSSGDRAA